MSATITSKENGIITIQITVELSKSMLGTEEAILVALNEAGNLATGYALKQFDTDGEPLELAGRTWTSKGLVPKIYQCPYGEIPIERHLYQNSDGGETVCPLDQDARIIVTSTPRFAKQVSAKYAMLPAAKVADDLLENHGRQVSRSYLQNVSEAVGQIVPQTEETWHYHIPKLPSAVSTVSMGVDGTCLLLCQEGYREAMVGTLSLYDKGVTINKLSILSLRRPRNFDKPFSQIG
jgi:hypothetical protein